MTNEIQTDAKPQKSKFRRTIRRMNIETLDQLGDFGYVPFHFLRGIKIGVSYIHEIPDLVNDLRLSKKNRLEEIQRDRHKTLSESVVGSDKPKTPDRYRYNNLDAWSVTLGAFTGMIGCVASYASLASQENYKIALAIPLLTNLGSLVHKAYKRNEIKLGETG